MKIKFEWEEISFGVHRAKVINGWIISSRSYNHDGIVISESMTFIPDLEHKWEIEND